MNIHTTDRYHIAFFVSHEELSACGLDDGYGDGDGDWTRKITRCVLEELGVPVGGVLEIEAYPGYDGVMVFTSLSPDGELETSYYLFDSLNDVIACCASVPFHPVLSALARYDGSFVLMVSDTAANILSLGYTVSEYARPLHRPRTFLLALREHGAILLERDAVSLLAPLA